MHRKRSAGPTMFVADVIFLQVRQHILENHHCFPDPALDVTVAVVCAHERRIVDGKWRGRDLEVSGCQKLQSIREPGANRVVDRAQGMVRSIPTSLDETGPVPEGTSGDPRQVTCTMLGKRLAHKEGRLDRATDLSLARTKWAARSRGGGG